MRGDLKQSRIQNYITKKTKSTIQTKQDTNQGGRYRNVRPKQKNTDQNEEESEVELEVYSHNYPKKVCPSFLLITPADIIFFRNIVAKIKKIESSFQKQEIFKLIANNMKYQGCSNIDNLCRIHDDDFWFLVMPRVMQIVVQQIQSISCKIKTLTANSAQFIDMTRKEAFLILASMFLGIMPRQSVGYLSFGKLMEIKNDEARQRIQIRYEKLKCLINYFKAIVKNQHLFKQKIRIERRHNFNTSYFQKEENPMVKVDFVNLSNVSIEDHYCKAIMTDFANKRIGGGVLGSGCVQQEILFSIFPEAIVCRAICEQLEDSEAVVIYGAIRFSNYEGYSNQFKFKSSFQFKKFSARRSVIAVIDALDFSERAGGEQNQYCKKSVRRQINKAFAGFNSLCFPQIEDMPICTGKWGCGAFKGDEELKFIIQWIACSHARREMIYVSDSVLKLAQFRLMVAELKDFTTADMINILDEYYKLRNRQKVGYEMGLIAYIKNFVI